MPGTVMDKKLKKKFSKEVDDENSHCKKQKLKSKDKNYKSLSRKTGGNCVNAGNVNGRIKKKLLSKAAAEKIKSAKKRHSMNDLNVKIATFKTKDSVKSNGICEKSRNLKRRRQIKKEKNIAGLDEASRLQRRTRYLLIKIKLEQNLIDAYSAEGWKGQSREKIKPEKELQRAKKQILNCKLGIREVIHQLDMLSSAGSVNDLKVAPDGSVHHEHIICAKCGLREAFRDNDIILCDGTCNRAFHQKCLDPPLATEDIPPENEGWFCKFCESKMEVLEATNAHLGTHFTMDINWQDVFKEEAALPEGGNSSLCQTEEWPSDDSEDDDYDPERIERCNSEGVSVSGSDSDCSSSFLGSLEDEALLSPGRYEDVVNGSFDNSLDLIGVGFDEMNAGEVLCHPRQRVAVDYAKLHDEMFGKNASEHEQISDDEDWGPAKRRRKGKETDAASTLITLGETDKNLSENELAEVKDKSSNSDSKRPIFRLPHMAVEKLRLVFAENELPVRAVREDLSKQLGLDIEKVNKWFKNARYLALKIRKAERETLSADANCIHKESIPETALDIDSDRILSKNKLTSQIAKSFKRYTRRKNRLLNNSLKIKLGKKQTLQPHRSKMSIEFGEDESLKHLWEKAKQVRKRLKSKSRADMQEVEARMEMLCEIKNRVEKLQQVLRELPNHIFAKTSAVSSSESSVIYVPVAELREKG